MVGEGDSLTTKTGGQRLSHLHPAPTIAPSHPQAWLLSRNRKEGTRGWPGRWKVSGIGRLPVWLQKDGLPRDEWRLGCCHRGCSLRGLTRTFRPAFTLTLPENQGPEGGSLCLLHIAPDMTMAMCPRGPGANRAVGWEIRLRIPGKRSVGEYSKKENLHAGREEARPRALTTSDGRLEGARSQE